VELGAKQPAGFDGSIDGGAERTLIGGCHGRKITGGPGRPGWPPMRLGRIFRA
jgi:hypothetical protein